MRVSDLYRIAYLTDRRAIEESTRDRHEYEMRLWCRHTTDPQCDKITGATFDAFRADAVAGGRSPRTIESVIDTLLTVMRAASIVGLVPHVPQRGTRLRITEKAPQIPQIGDLSAAYSCAEYGPIRSRRDGRYWRAFFAVAYFTALRRGDLFALTWAQIGREAITVRAHKTGKVHVIPLHPVLKRIINEYREGLDAGPLFRMEICQFRRELARICLQAGVPLITPQGIRRLSANQYELAHAGAGPLILGHSLHGATRFYLSSPMILQDASQRLAVPAAMLTAADRERIGNREKQLLLGFRSLPEAEKESVLTIVKKMA